MFVTREFNFDAAHFLSNYYGKCERLHGHTYKLHITLEGKVQENGMVIDFVIFKRIVNKHILEKLDHHLLNDLIENPSAERVVIWIWQQLQDLPKLLKEELEDPNLSQEIKALLQKNDLPDNLSKIKFDETLRLHEIKLWETPNAFITYHGK